MEFGRNKYQPTKVAKLVFPIFPCSKKFSSGAAKWTIHISELIEGGVHDSPDLS